MAWEHLDTLLAEVQAAPVQTETTNPLTVASAGWSPRTFDLSAFRLHPHQAACVEDIRAQFLANDETQKRVIYRSPTGSGKSLMYLSALGSDPFGWGLTPRLEIIVGMLEKLGHKDAGELSENALVALAFEYRISTPVRYRNMLAKGVVPFLPWRLYIDEGHHSPADTYKDIRAYLPSAGIIEFTATPFRGTAKATQAYLEGASEVVTVLTIPAAANLNIISIPSVTIWPLVDDDEIQMTNGEFTTRSASEAGISREADLVGRIQAAGFWAEGRARWDKPTMFAVSGTNQAHSLAERLREAGMSAEAVTQNTSREDRARIFAACLRSETALIQIDVVSEGVDLAIRRLIDMRPTFSPVKWLQTVGRITRPGGGSEYIVCNRNLERHAYLMEGILPCSKVAEAQNAFPKVSARMGARVVGMSAEGVGRFQAVPVRFADTSIGAMYCLYNTEGFVRTEYAVLLHPNLMEPVYATRQTVADEAGERTYGRWARAERLPDLDGYASVATGSLTDKQRQSWERNARHYGLDQTAKVTKKSIQALFLLRDLGLRIRG